MRRVRSAHAAVVALLLGVAGCGSAAAAPTEEPSQEEERRTADRATAQVERRDLVTRESLRGTLGHGGTRDVFGGPEGTLTGLPSAGTVVERGGHLWQVNGRGVPLLYGGIPMFRTLEPGVVGGDVRQLEENLVALGHAQQRDGLPDDRYDARTAEAVRAWQRANGWPVTGVVDTGDAVVQPGPVRVTGGETVVGQQVSGTEPVVEVSGTQRLVTLEVEPKDLDLVPVDAAVSVELPDGTELPARVREVGRVAAASGGSGDQTSGQEERAAKVTVTVALDDEGAASGLDGAPVEVHAVAEAAQDVLAVPVYALLTSPDGGYAVERVTGPDTDLVEVELGAFADGFVEVRGDLDEGDDVVVSS